MERSFRVAVFLLCLAPLCWLLYSASVGRLGPDPAEALMLETGEWSLRFLALGLLASPLRAWTGSALPIKLRRMLGLYAFFYACVHFVSFLQFYTGWDVSVLLEELAERTYILAGFAAWLLLLPLALTSTRASRRRLGARWIQLHRLVYVAAVLACLHLFWQSRSDVGEALLYCLVFGLLLGWRMRRRVLARP